MTDTRLAFEECFARIDREFLEKAEEEVRNAGCIHYIHQLRVSLKCKCENANVPPCFGNYFV